MSIEAGHKDEVDNEINADPALDMDEINVDGVYIPEDNELDSRCRHSTNILSYYLTELNGLNILIRIVLLWICFKKLKKIKNNYILFLLIIVSLHVIVHIIIIIASLPPFCDSSNNDWIPGTYFNYVHCHLKYKVYYSDVFWFLDSVLPNILLVLIMYYTKGFKGD